MIIVAGGINSDTPLKQVFKGWKPYHRADLFTDKPHTAYSVNKKLLESLRTFYDNPVYIGKSYGAYLVSESFSMENSPLLFSLPLVDDEGEPFGFPEAKNNFYAFYTRDDDHMDERILKDNQEVIENIYKYDGDHSFRPVSDEKKNKVRRDIKEVLENEGSGQSQGSSMHDLNMSGEVKFPNSHFFKRRERSVVELKKEGDYTFLNFEGLENISDKAKKFADPSYGPITDVIEREISVPGLNVFQTNIIDNSEMNPLISGCPATEVLE